MQTMRRVELPARGSARSQGAAATAAVEASALVAGFLALQLFIGYEWFMSGLSKLVAGDFATNLGGTLAEMTQDQGGWYKSFIDDVVIPNGQLFGNLVILGELTLGVVLIATTVVLLTWRSQLGAIERSSLLTLVAIAAIVGAFMSVNFHLAVGATAPWLISPDPNDQGVDLDSLMVVMQLVLAAVSLRYVVSTTRALR